MRCRGRLRPARRRGLRRAGGRRAARDRGLVDGARDHAVWRRALRGALPHPRALRERVRDRSVAVVDESSTPGRRRGRRSPTCARAARAPSRSAPCSSSATGRRSWRAPRAWRSRASPRCRTPSGRRPSARCARRAWSWSNSADVPNDPATVVAPKPHRAGLRWEDDASPVAGLFGRRSRARRSLGRDGGPAHRLHAAADARRRPAGVGGDRRRRCGRRAARGGGLRRPLGRVWAARVRADGSLGSPLPAGSGQIDVRDVQVAVTDRGELVVVWAALVNRGNGGSAVRYAVAAPGRSFSGARTLAAVGSNTGATPRMAALRGGTVAVIFRDTRPPRTGGVLRYARRAPHGSFGTARSLGRDGVGPEIQASPGGGALLAWGQGPLTRRALVVASAQRGAPLPGLATSVAGSVRSITLTASGDGRRGSPGRGATAAGRRASPGAPGRATAPRSVPCSRSGRWRTASRASRSARPAACSRRGTPAARARRRTSGWRPLRASGRPWAHAAFRRGRVQPDLADPPRGCVHAAGALHPPDRRHIGRPGPGGRRRPGDRRRHPARRRVEQRHARGRAQRRQPASWPGPRTPASGIAASVDR